MRAPLRSRPRYTQKLLQQEFFAHRDFETQALLRTEALTHRQLLHTEAFTHRCFTHRYLHPQTPLHAELLTQMFLLRSLYKQMFFYTQKLYTHPRLCTQKLSHTGAFAQGKLLHTRTLFPQFWTIDAHFVRETSTESNRILIFLRFLMDNMHLVVRKGCARGAFHEHGYSRRLKRLYIYAYVF